MVRVRSIDTVVVDWEGKVVYFQPFLPVCIYNVLTDAYYYLGPGPDGTTMHYATLGECLDAHEAEHDREMAEQGGQ